MMKEKRFTLNVSLNAQKIVEWMSLRFPFRNCFFSYVLGTRLITWDPAFVSVAWPEEVAKLRSNFISCSHVQHQTWIFTNFKQNLCVELCSSLKTSSSWFAAGVCFFSGLGSWSIPKKSILNKYFSFRYSSEINWSFRVDAFKFFRVICPTGYWYNTFVRCYIHRNLQNLRQFQLKFLFGKRIKSITEWKASSMTFLFIVRS